MSQSHQSRAGGVSAASSSNHMQAVGKGQQPPPQQQQVVSPVQSPVRSPLSSNVESPLTPVHSPLTPVHSPLNHHHRQASLTPSSSSTPSPMVSRKGRNRSVSVTRNQQHTPRTASQLLHSNKDIMAHSKDLQWVNTCNCIINPQPHIISSATSHSDVQFETLKIAIRRKHALKKSQF